MSFQILDQVFYKDNNLQRSQLEKIVGETLHNMDDGELFLEYKQNENYVFEDGKLKTSSTHTRQGFGFRGVIADKFAYAHSSSLDIDSVKRAGQTVNAIKNGYSGTYAGNTNQDNTPLYTADNPLLSKEIAEKIGLLEEMDAYARSLDPKIQQVTASLAGTWQVVDIIRPDGSQSFDVRPLVRLNISVVAGHNGRIESGSMGQGGRTNYSQYFEPASWKAQVEYAVRQALVNLESIDAPAGDMPVVLGPGWPGVLLHEAIGHGLEGDFNRKKTSVFSGLVGERVAAPGVTIVDDGTLSDRRGSLTIDDEGTKTQNTVLIEDGILKGYMQDRMNARLMGVDATGNGRRESYAHSPMPRMTNTYMLGGNHTLDEMISSVDKGLYAVNFGGGQVDIVSGKFVFSASEAYLIENGKIGPAVKGATLIGDGADCLTKIKMIGNDFELDRGVGTCGKDGQSVPVGVGQPSLLLDSITVGGTQT